MIPTRDVPEGLTADEYFRLSIQYLLLGWKKQMVTSAKRAAELKTDLGGKLRHELKTEDYEKIGIALGVVESAMDIATSASEVLHQTWKLLTEAVTAADQATDEVEPVAEIKRELQNTFGQITRDLGGFFGKVLEETILPAFGFPGRDLPEGLSAEEYLDLGRHYKGLGWCEQSRDALVRCIELADEHGLAETARRYLRTRIPKMPVPHRAVQRNIEGFNQLTRGDMVAAKKTFEEITREYPDFEWARGNLGTVYSRLGELEKAEEVLSDVLDYNPDYLNGWLHYARLKAAKLEVAEAQRYLDKAIRLDPEDESARALKQVVDFLSL
jgi:tetratricopeptide (TPR) repeat protein